MTASDGLKQRARRLARRVMRTTYRTGLIGFGRLPHRVQRWVVRIASPSYTVGALVVLQHEGRVLVLRQLHRDGWTLPGGLLAHGEAPLDGVQREVREELGLTLDLPAGTMPLATLVEPHAQRVDVVFHRHLTERPPVRPRGEATRGEWKTVEELLADQGQDEATREILTLVRQALAQ